MEAVARGSKVVAMIEPHLRGFRKILMLISYTGIQDAIPADTLPLSKSYAIWAPALPGSRSPVFQNWW